MKLDRKEKDQIRKFEKSIFDNKYSYGERLYLLYLILYKKLHLFKHEFESTLSNEEIEAELFLYCDKLYNAYDSNKSSLVPYIEKYMFLFLSRYIKKINKKNRPDSFLLTEEDNTYILPEEYYLSIPKILFEDRYLGNALTKDEKYIVYKILLIDEEDLSTRKLSNNIKLSRENLRTRLNSLKEKLIIGGFNEHCTRKNN